MKKKEKIEKKQEDRSRMINDLRFTVNDLRTSFSDSSFLISCSLFPEKKNLQLAETPSGTACQRFLVPLRVGGQSGVNRAGGNLQPATCDLQMIYNLRYTVYDFRTSFSDSSFLISCSLFPEVQQIPPSAGWRSTLFAKGRQKPATCNLQPSTCGLQMIYDLRYTIYDFRTSFSDSSFLISYSLFPEKKNLQLEERHLPAGRQGRPKSEERSLSLEACGLQKIYDIRFTVNDLRTSFSDSSFLISYSLFPEVQQIPPSAGWRSTPFAKGRQKTAACNLQLAICGLPLVAGNLQPATRNLQLKKEYSTVSIVPVVLISGRPTLSMAPQTSGPEKANINPSNPSFTGKGGGHYERAIRACRFGIFNN